MNPPLTTTSDDFTGHPIIQKALADFKAEIPGWCNHCGHDWSSHNDHGCKHCGCQLYEPQPEGEAKEAREWTLLTAVEKIVELRAELQKVNSIASERGVERLRAVSACDDLQERLRVCGVGYDLVIKERNHLRADVLRLEKEKSILKQERNAHRDEIERLVKALVCNQEAATNEISQLRDSIAPICQKNALLRTDLAAARKELEESIQVNEALIAKCERMRTILRWAHDAMQTWFSSEYLDHPETIRVTRAIDGLDT